MSSRESDYAVVVKSSRDFDATVEKARASLAENGFGVLSEIDVSAALKKRLGVDYQRTLILGACNPPLAHRALNAAPDISVLLPCNVVVRQTESGVEVAAIAARVLSRLITHSVIEQVADEVDQRLRKALEALA